jgi:hypothetical protein
LKLTQNLRTFYVAAILAQDSVFFETLGPGEVVLRVRKDIDTIRIGFGEKLGYIVWAIFTVISVCRFQLSKVEFRLIQP